MSSKRGGASQVWDPYGPLISSGPLTQQPKQPTAKEYRDLVERLPPNQKIEMSKVTTLFKKLSTQLSETKNIGTEDRRRQLEKISIEIFEGLRNGEVDPKLQNTIKSQLYEVYLRSNEFSKALDLYPEQTRTQVGDRLHGFFVLTKPIRKMIILSSNPVDDFFKYFPTARQTLMNILLKIPENIKLSEHEKEQLFRIGNVLPLYFLLISHSQCGGSFTDENLETRVRLILGDSINPIQPNLFKRVCNFASEH